MNQFHLKVSPVKKNPLHDRVVHKQPHHEPDRKSPLKTPKSVISRWTPSFTLSTQCRIYKSPEATFHIPRIEDFLPTFPFYILDSRTPILVNSA